MDAWRPVHTTRHPGGWALVEPRHARIRSWKLRTARMEPGLLVPAGAFCMILYLPFAVLLGPYGTLLTLTLGILTPVVLHQHSKRQAARALGPHWRTTEVFAAHFRDLPESLTRLVDEMVRSLDGMWDSRAARAGWLAVGKLHDAHSAVWQTALLLLDTVDEHALLRESARYDELSPLVAARAAELAGTGSVVADVAGQLREACAKVARLDAVIIAEEDRRNREHHIATLERQLTGGTGRVARQSVPPVWQDALDAIHACLDGALTVLSIGRRG